MSADSTPLTAEDPYVVIRHDLLRKLELVDEHLAELERVNSPNGDSASIKNSSKALKRSIKDASFTYKDLETCIKLSSDSISEQELYERKCYAKASHDRLQRARQQLYNTTGSSGNSIGSMAGPTLPDHKTNGHGYDVISAQEAAENGTSNMASMQPHRSNGSYGRSSNIPGRMSSLQMMQQAQDETLDDLDAAVVRVGYMAENINQEIGYQGKLLDEMESDLDQAAEEMGVVMSKLSHFLGTKDRWQLCTIAILFLVAILLLMLVIYT